MLAVLVCRITSENPFFLQTAKGFLRHTTSYSYCFGGRGLSNLFSGSVLPLRLKVSLLSHTLRNFFGLEGPGGRPRAGITRPGGFVKLAARQVLLS